MWRNEGETSWRVTWLPDEGDPDHPGHTYTPGDVDMPRDFPGGDDPDAILAWAKERWGGPRFRP